MGLATWPAATLIKKNMSYWSPFNKSRPRGGVFLRKILSTFVLLSVLIKKGNGHFLSLWSMHGSAVHGPACDILYDICNTMTESSTRRLKLLTLNFYNYEQQKELCSTRNAVIRGEHRSRFRRFANRRPRLRRRRKLVKQDYETDVNRNH